MATIKVYAQDLEKRLGWNIENEDDTPKAVFTFQWEMNGAKYPTVKIFRDDVDGGDYLEYDIDPETFFTEDLPTIKKDNIGFDESAN